MKRPDLFPIVQRGQTHIRQHHCCQDRAAGYVRDTIAIAAVSDGCGSCMLSHIGASLCVQTFIDTFAVLPVKTLQGFCTFQRYEEPLRQRLTQAIQAAISRTQLPHQLLSATLIGCISYKGRAVVLHTGDGFVARQRLGHIDIVSAPEQDGGADHTFFATDPSAIGHLRITRLRSYEKLLLSTDGLAQVPLQKELFIPEQLQTLLTTNQSLEDDCGAVILQRKHPSLCTESMCHVPCTVCNGVGGSVWIDGGKIEEPRNGVGS